MKPKIRFELQATLSGTRARAGKLTSSRSEALTPVFMPVGTHATVRTQSSTSLAAEGFPILLANTYHLVQRPGLDVFEKLGTVHQFMKWGGSVLTDSGGFQIFSQAKSISVREEGILFRSYVDGKQFRFSPKESIEAQKVIGSDIMMVFDHCLAFTRDKKQVENAMERTHRWALESLEARGESEQALFGIVQGGCFPKLRKISAQFLTSLPFDGFAVGGLAVGEEKNIREEMTEVSTDLLPKQYPRYLMGVGTPLDLLEAVHRGVDMFDCILPTAMAQQGTAYTSRGKLSLRRGCYRYADVALDPNCQCETCRNHSRAYLHHLVKCQEYLGWRLIASHNLHFYSELMKEIRDKILSGKFVPFYEEKRQWLDQPDLDTPPKPPARKRRQTRTQLGDYEVVKNRNGFQSIRHVPSGEVMHSVNCPESEAKELYVEQSFLKDRLKQKSLVIWDVGLGSGYNAMAAISEIESVPNDCQVSLYSFETDKAPFQLALKNTNLFTHVRHAGPASLVETHQWSSRRANISWKLLMGDFLENYSKAPQPDIVFYDPYSYKTNPVLWELGCFQRLHDYFGEKPAVLLTYTNSTAIRATLLAAGFYVAKGKATGPKSETTIALNRVGQGQYEKSLLQGDWLSRWENSQAKFPRSGKIDPNWFSSRVLEHPQFH